MQHCCMQQTMTAYNGHVATVRRCDGRRLIVGLTLRGRSCCMYCSQGMLKGYSRVLKDNQAVLKGTQGVLKGTQGVRKGSSRAACSLCAAGPAAGTEARALLPRVRAHAALLAEGAAQPSLGHATHPTRNAMHRTTKPRNTQPRSHPNITISCMLNAACLMLHAARCTLHATGRTVPHAQPEPTASLLPRRCRVCVQVSEDALRDDDGPYAVLCCAAPSFAPSGSRREPPRGDLGARCDRCA